MSVGALGTAGLGLIFWWVAARSLSPSVVGQASAAISAAGLIALASELGLGTLLLIELQRRHIDPAAMVASAMAYASGAALVLSVAVSLLTGVFAAEFGIAPPTLSSVLVVTLVSVFGAAALVLDQAFAGLMRAGLQMKRNLLFGLLRLAGLSLILSTLGQTATELHIIAAWLVAIALSLLWLACTETFPRPKWIALLPMPRLGRAAGHHLLNLSVQAPGLAMPVIAAAVVSPEATAALYVALMLLSAALVVPSALATLIQPTATRDPAKLASRLRLSLGLSVGIALATALSFSFVLPTLFALLGDTYAAIAGGSLQLIGLAALGTVFKYHYLAVARLRLRLLPSGLIMAMGAVVELGAASLGGARGGLQGLVNGWLVALAVECIVMLPAVVGVAAGGISAQGACCWRSSREVLRGTNEPALRQTLG